MQAVLIATIGVFIGAIAFRLLLAMNHRGYNSLVDVPMFLDGFRPKDVGFLTGMWKLTLKCFAEVFHVFWMMLGSVVPLSVFGLLRLARDIVGNHVLNMSWHKLKVFLDANSGQ